MYNVLIVTFGEINNRINNLIYELENIKKVKIIIINGFEEDNVKIIKRKYDGIILTGYGETNNLMCNQKKNEINYFRKECSFNKVIKVKEHNLQNIFDLIDHNINSPIYGICYGFQVLNYYYGGYSTKLVYKNTGPQETYLNNKINIFKNIPKKLICDYNHYYYCKNDNPKVKDVAFTNNLKGIAKQYSNIHYGSMFHIIGSDNSLKQIITNFISIVKNENEKILIINYYKIILLITVFFIIYLLFKVSRK